MTPPRKVEELDHAAKLRSFQRQTGSNSIEEAKYCAPSTLSSHRSLVKRFRPTPSPEADVDESQGDLAAAIAAFKANGAGLPSEGRANAAAESSGEQGGCCVA